MNDHQEIKNSKSKTSHFHLQKFKKYILIVSILIFITFIFFSYLVSKELFAQLDFDLTVKFQDKIPHRFDEPFSALSIIGSAEISMLIWAILAIYLLIRRFWWAFLSMALLPIALLMEIFGKVFVLHPGPPYLFYRGVIEFNFPSHYIKTNYSYPSGHMLRTTFLATFLITYFLFRTNLKTQIIAIPTFLFFVAVMMVSRIYLGEHWMTDVVGGTLLGISAGLLAGVMIPIKKSHETKQEY